MNTYEKAAHTKAATKAKQSGEDWMVCRDQCRETYESDAFFAISAYRYENSTLEVESCEVLAVYSPAGLLPDYD